MMSRIIVSAYLLPIARAFIKSTDHSLQSHHPRIVMIGETGAAKTRLANALICKEMVIRDRLWFEDGSWIGDNSKQAVTFINTHGLEDELNDEKIEDIVDALKENIRYALVFIIVFKQWNNEMNPSMRVVIFIILCLCSLLLVKF